MAVYAVPEDLRVYTARNTAVDVPDDDAAVEVLLDEAQREVDRACGPWPFLSTGLKFDPPLLPVTGREALRRATCAAAEWLLMLEPEERVGASDLLPAGLSITQRAGRVSPRMVEELAGHGLMLYSGTYVAPDGAELA